MESSKKLQAEPLLKLNKHILKDLHNLVGVDFEKEDFTIAEVLLPKTLKAIIKEHSITPNKTDNYLLLQDTRATKNVFRIIKFYADSTFDISLGCTWEHRNSLDSYWKKGAFESERKRATSKCFLLIVPKKDREESYKTISYSKEKARKLEKNFDTCGYKNTRYSVKADKVRTTYNINTKESVVTGYWSVTELTSNRQLQFDINHTSSIKLLSTSPYDLIDKSGYNVFEKRRGLNKKATELREGRNRDKVINLDYSIYNTRAKVQIELLYKSVMNKMGAINVLEHESRLNDIIHALRVIQNLSSNHRIHLAKLENTKSKPYSYYAYRNTKGYYAYRNTKEVESYFEEVSNKVYDVETKILR